MVGIDRNLVESRQVITRKVAVASTKCNGSFTFACSILRVVPIRSCGELESPSCFVVSLEDVVVAFEIVTNLHEW